MVEHSRLLKQVVNEAADEKIPEAWLFSPTHPELSEQLFSRVGYVEAFFEPRTKLGACFSNRLQVADGALKNRNLRHRIAGGFQFCADLFFEVG